MHTLRMIYSDDYRLHRTKKNGVTAWTHQVRMYVPANADFADSWKATNHAPHFVQTECGQVFVKIYRPLASATLHAQHRTKFTQATGLSHDAILLLWKEGYPALMAGVLTGDINTCQVIIEYEGFSERGVDTAAAPG